MSTAWKNLGVFYALTFLLLIVIPLINGLMSTGGMDFDGAGARASAETGLAWTSNLLVVFRLCMVEPVLALIVFGSAVPSLAAVVVCAGQGGQLRELLSRFRIRLPWRDALREYGLLFAIMVSGLFCVYALRMALPGPEYTQTPGIVGPGIVAALLAAALLDQGGVLEELGWRGYALPRLQDGLLSPLGAAVVVGIGWGLWHIPRDVTWGVVERLGMVQYLFLYLPSFLAGTITSSIIIAFFVNRCGGSVIPAIMIHGLGNDAVGISGRASIEVVLTPYHQLTKALPFALIALAIIWISGRQLGLARK
jgi:hypothetical protein